MTAAREALSRVFGHEEFRAGQEETIGSILAGDDVLAVMPTGAGKSLLYQLPAVIGAGPVVVVSPLISLMRDQVGALQAKGIAAGALHSASDPDDAERVLRLLNERRIKLLYLAPERLAQPATIATLMRLRPKILAVDEAHCVSRWADDFRPDYGVIAAVAKEIGDPQTVAVTATAGPRTRDDIVARLFARKPREFLRSFARPNIAIAFRRRGDASADVRAIVSRHRGESGIVYCASRATTDRLARDLDRAGIPAIPYHAGLDAETRDSNQDRFLREPGIVMTATIAFGMGIDKPDVRFVCHADLPHSIEAYYQEIGRAGRDGKPAAAVALVDPRGAARASLTPEATAMLSLARHPGCRWQGLLRSFGEESKPCGVCDLCTRDRLRLRRLSLLIRNAAGGVRNAVTHKLLEATDGSAHGRDEEGLANVALASPETDEPGSAAPSRMTIAQMRLRAQLVSERGAIARARRVPPSSVATDAMLDALVAVDPTPHGTFHARTTAAVSPREPCGPALADLLAFLAQTRDSVAQPVSGRLSRNRE